MNGNELEDASERAHRLHELRRARLELAAEAKRELARILADQGPLEDDVSDEQAAFLEQVIASVIAAGFPVADRLALEGGVRIRPWARTPGELVVNVEWNPHERLVRDDSFPFMEVIKTVTQAVGVTLEMQGFQVTPFGTEILVTPGSAQ
jgi:hypothetical protein